MRNTQYDQIKIELSRLFKTLLIHFNGLQKSKWIFDIPNININNKIKPPSTQIPKENIFTEGLIIY